MSAVQEKRAMEWLQSGDVRPTRQRLDLATLLVGDGQDRHTCAESLHAMALERDLSVSLATVYNTLRVFQNAGLLNEITVDGQKSYFDTRLDEHPHYYWEDQAKLSDAPKSSVVISELAEPPEGTEIARVDMVIRLRQR